MGDFKKFLNYIENLKKVKRMGWETRGVKNPESVAEHSYLTALLVMFLAKDFEVDREKAIKMALVHDAGESITGDIVWQKGKANIPDKKKEKEEKEELAIREIFGNLDSEEEYISLWREYKERKTKEALFVKEMEVFERVVQAKFYEEEQSGVDLSDFYSNAELYIKNHKIKKMVEEVLEEGK